MNRIRTYAFGTLLLAAMISGCGQQSGVPTANGPIGSYVRGQPPARSPENNRQTAYVVPIEGPIVVNRLPPVDDEPTVRQAGAPATVTNEHATVSGTSEPLVFDLNPPGDDDLSTLVPTPAVDVTSYETPHGALTGSFDFDQSMSAIVSGDEPEIMVTDAQLSQIRVPVEVSRRVSRLLQEGDRLAERKALFAAETKFREALRTITQSMDAQLGKPYHTQALARAMKALSEAEDFATIGQDRTNIVSHLAGFISGHDTPVLKATEVPDLTPMVAVKRYHEYAYQHLMKAGGRDPLASESLFACGQILNMQQASTPDSIVQSPSCVPYLQAALTVNGANVRAANELGVLLAQRGRLKEAVHVFEFSARTAPTPLVLENLADAHTRMGNVQAAQETRQQAGQLAASISAPQQPQSRIVWVDPQAFKHLGSVPTASEVAAVQRMSDQMAPQAPSTGEAPMEPVPMPMPQRQPARTAARPNLTGVF